MVVGALALTVALTWPLAGCPALPCRFHLAVNGGDAVRWRPLDLPPGAIQTAGVPEGGAAVRGEVEDASRHDRVVVAGGGAGRPEPTSP